MREFPFRNINGDTVWACCISSIGPECQHITMPDGSIQRPSAEPRCGCPAPYADCTHPPTGPTPERVS